MRVHRSVARYTAAVAADVTASPIRATLDAREAALAPAAAREATSAGRARPEPPAPLRLAYQVDRDRIIHTRAFRRLKHKTQVFISPDSDHVVTRMTHTIEVQQVARTIARALNLNEDLTEAIAIGHDLGHTPFGHAGEEALSELLPDGFRHNEQSLRIVELLERDGAGLNLTVETRDGILKHSKERQSIAAEAWGSSSTLEGQIVKIADSIAYLNHDIQDAVRAGLISEHELPGEARRILGGSHSRRIDTLVTDCVSGSTAAARGEAPAEIRLSAAVLSATDALREFMFQRVYLAEATLHAARRGQRVVRALFRHYESHPDEIDGWSLDHDPPWRRAGDYVSGMTDHFADRRAEDLRLARERRGAAPRRTIPVGWRAPLVTPTKQHLRQPVRLHLRPPILAGVAVVAVAASVIALIAATANSASDPAVAAITAPAPPAQAGASNPGDVSVRAASTANVRAEPNRFAEVVAILPGDRAARALGRTSDSAWVRIAYPPDASTGGWVRADALQLLASAVDELRVLVTLSPAPTPTGGAAVAGGEELPDLIIVDAFLLRDGRLAVGIRNVGDAPLIEAFVPLNVSKSAGDILGVLRIGPTTLAPGASATVVTPVVVKETGSYLLELDRSDEIRESQEFNNTRTALLIAGGG